MESINLKINEDTIKNINNKKVKIPRCFVCMDEGTIIYIKKVNGIDYEYIASCTCDKAKGYRYDGKECNVKSDNYIAEANRLFNTDKLYTENLNKFIEKHMDNKEVMEELERRGIKLYRG